MTSRKTRGDRVTLRSAPPCSLCEDATVQGKQELMRSIRMSLAAVVFAVLGACTQIEAPAAPGDDDVDSSQSELLSPGALPGSLQTCLSHCTPDDLDCI